MNELVSVVIPLYKEHEYISKCIASINSQSYTNVEIVFVDSGENGWVQDKTEFETKYTTQNPNGPGHARNLGIEMADGTYIAFLDSDDKWLRKKLECQSNYFGDYEFIYSDQYIKKNGTKMYQRARDFENNPSIEFFQLGHGIPLRTVIVSRDLLLEHRFDERFKAREDPHLWTRLLRETKPMRVDNALAVKQKRPGSLTSDHELVYTEEMKEIRDLIIRYPNLQKYKGKRLYEANLRRARKELSLNNKREARKYIKIATNFGEFDIRYLAILAISLLPVGSDRSLTYLQKIQGIIS